ncbi:DNA-binding proteins Bright/BRCAA1/RBP1 and proteins containing BRIGHT domain [Diplodia seriata]|uniref:DNA-binding proteins Bright/BRCAA1/RBP1 and proteins containing BRIGHT domain n=1 Tax=Diplodia seriata TaxID=420778 RepID=A0A0G2GYE7_9PEZI|nr:putative sin3 binding protein [Diplodia seriata]OMP87091.1 Protein STB3 [Diplodia seriata]
MASTAPSKPVSPFARAFASQSSSVEIPKPYDPATGNHRAAMLPTPPNSISPTLPPQHKLHSSSVPHTNSHGQNDSDVDLFDAEQPPAPAPLSSAALSGLEAADTITPTMLAKHHLPDILLNNGPVAIRHVLMNLAQSVPGFSRIPQAKARRLVVAALESRTVGSSAVSEGEVVFEKVGWGRWDAYIMGQPRPERNPTGTGIPVHGMRQSAFSPPASVPDSYAMSADGLRIPRVGHRERHGQFARREDLYSGSWAASSAMSGHDVSDYDVDMNMAEHEADKMSMDGDEAGYDSPPAPENMDDDIEIDEEDEATDEEDWAGIGAQVLRQSSMGGFGGGLGGGGVMRDYNQLSRSVTARARMSPQPRSFANAYLKSRGNSRGVSASYQERAPHLTGAAPAGWTSIAQQNPQERDAIEALLKMGSM